MRELANALERAAILADGDEIGPRASACSSRSTTRRRPRRRPASLADLERDAIEQTLAAVGGNRKEAAARLGIGLRTLYDKLKRYRLG